MSGAVVRRATLQDYQGVLDIGIMYNGTDYLPYFYKEFIKDPDYMCYVCVVDGEIVGFCCELVHDGGRVVQGRALRIKESHRGKGYFHLMEEQRKKDIITHLASAKSLQYVRDWSSINWATMDTAVKVIDNINLYKFSISKSQFYSATPVSSVTRMYKPDLQAVFEKTSVCHKLFPRHLIYSFNLAVGLHTANIRHIINDNTTAFATTSSQDKLYICNKSSKMNSDAVTGPEGISLLTIGCHYRAPVGQRCAISFHGNDLETFDAHVRAHIEHSPSFDDRLFMAIFTPESFPNETVMKTFNLCGITNLDFIPICTIRSDIEPRSAKAKY